MKAGEVRTAVRKMHRVIGAFRIHKLEARRVQEQKAHEKEKKVKNIALGASGQSFSIGYRK